MNIYCDLCANKDRKETCRTCISGILRMTTDGAEYSLPSNYSGVFKPFMHSFDDGTLTMPDISMMYLRNGFQRKEKAMEKTSDSLIIGFNSSAGKDGTVLIVGRKKPREAVDIINAFEGEEALELYKKLTTPKVKDE